MPLFKRQPGMRGFAGGVTSSQIVLADIAVSIMDTDLTSVSSNHDTFTTAKAVKDYVDTVAATQDTFAELDDTTITSVQDNNHVQYDGTASRWINNAFIDFSKIAAPSAPSTEEGRLYVKEIDANNNALAIKIQKAGTVVEVELTSPKATCGVCGSTDGAKDPTFNFPEGIMIVELYCGHSYQMDIPNLRRIQ
jgi:hypothetical protein